MFKTRECPRRLIPPDFGIVSGWLPHYRNGIAWTSGGLAEQPVIYLDAMELIERAISQLTAAQRER